MCRISMSLSFISSSRMYICLHCLALYTDELTLWRCSIPFLFWSYKSRSSFRITTTSSIGTWARARPQRQQES